MHGNERQPAERLPRDGHQQKKIRAKNENGLVWQADVRRKLTAHTTGPSATRGGASGAVALLLGMFMLFFQTSRGPWCPGGSSQSYFLGADLSGLGWASWLLRTSLGSTCSPKSSSMLLCRVSVRRRASSGLRLLLLGQCPGPGLHLAVLLKLKHSSSSLPQSRPLSGLLLAARPDRQPLSCRVKSSARGPTAGPRGSAGSQEACGALSPPRARALAEYPKPCLCKSSRCSPSSATSGILNSLELCWVWWGCSGRSRKAPSVLLL